ncbi:MAG TPA: hypothetical protein VHB50_07445 [Bryobacteraceae bacterium]|nr:hypothetical protein [Bryobacteraceae bacterium]
MFDRYVQATGGESAWRSKYSERDDVEGRTLDGGHVVLRATLALTRTGNSLNEIRVPEEAREGVYNGVAWAWTKLSGPRIKKGLDREIALRSARMLEEADWRTLYAKSRVTAIEEIAGRPCYKVLLLPSEDHRVEWFDTTTGLLARRTSTEQSRAGAVENTYTVESWREKDGLKQPSVMLAVRGGLRYRMSVLNVEYNELREPDELRLPAPVEGYLAALRAGVALPNAEEIIERHIFESGGAAAYEKLRTQRITGTLKFLSRNIEAHTEAWSAEEGRYYQLVDIPGMGKEEQGSNGEVAWERSPALGPRARSRGSLNGLGLTLDAAEVVGWRYLVGEVRTEAEESIDGRDCYRVRITSRNGSTTGVRWYDRKTGLLYRASVTLRTEMGAVPTIMTYEVYRRVNGIQWPVEIRMAMSGQELRFRADNVALNERLDDSVFRLPEEIQRITGIER